MKNILFFDTETTGLVNKHKGPTDPVQPLPVQLGMKLDSYNGQEMGALNMMVRPDGWEISPGATVIHGITKEIATDFGVHFITAVEIFLDYVNNADVVVAHNLAFDATVMRRSVHLYSKMVGETYTDPFEGKLHICTMLAAMDIVKAPHKGKQFGGKKRTGTQRWKWPKLSETMMYYFKEEIDGAHDALVDVRACAKVFYQLRKDGVFENGKSA